MLPSWTLGNGVGVCSLQPAVNCFAVHAPLEKIHHHLHSRSQASNIFCALHLPIAPPRLAN
eukprot:354382-Amphidinium_carterae.2